MIKMNAKLVTTLAIAASMLLLQACEASHEEQARDPANCEQMKDKPETYERCMETLK